MNINIFYVIFIWINLLAVGLVLFGSRVVVDFVVVDPFVVGIVDAFVVACVVAVDGHGGKMSKLIVEY